MRSTTPPAGDVEGGFGFVVGVAAGLLGGSAGGFVASAGESLRGLPDG
ncbi:hypothetical protein [Streptomyces sp. NPDC004135]